MREEWMRLAIDLAIENINNCQGGPFGAVIVRDDQAIATGVNRVTATNDPSAHAEVVAIRSACQLLNTFELTDCELYTSCEPCPMCLGAIYWARLKTYYFSCTREEAMHIGFDDDFIYREIPLSPGSRSIPGFPLLCNEGRSVFEKWIQSPNRIDY